MGKSYKFANLRAEAKKRAKAQGKQEQPEIEPFVMDDVEPPIVITAPDTLERQLVIAEMISPGGDFSAGQALPLLKALCGPAFPRVWALIKDDKDPNTAIALVQALVEHMFDAVTEAADVPGGSQGSSR
jgi:hypothetical protein